MKNKSNLTQDIHAIQQFTQGDLEASKLLHGGEPLDRDTVLERLKIIASAKRGVVRQEKQIERLKELLSSALIHIDELEGQNAGVNQKYIRRELKKMAWQIQTNNIISPYGKQKNNK